MKIFSFVPLGELAATKLLTRCPLNDNLPELMLHSDRETLQMALGHSLCLTLSSICRDNNITGLLRGPLQTELSNACKVPECLKSAKETSIVTI